MKEIELSKKIKALRQQAHLSQRQLAEATHLSIATIQGYEQGKFIPKRESLQKIADVFHISIDTLYQHKSIVIDDNIDKTHPINTILAKVDNHEQLTPEELEQYRNHVAKAIPSIKQSLESFAETLKQSLAEYYEAMNDEGQKEADLQIQKTIEKVTKQAENQAIDEATEKVQLLSRIPEYKKDSDA